MLSARLLLQSEARSYARNSELASIHGHNAIKESSFSSRGGGLAAGKSALLEAGESFLTSALNFVARHVPLPAKRSLPSARHTAPPLAFSQIQSLQGALGLISGGKRVS